MQSKMFIIFVIMKKDLLQDEFHSFQAYADIWCQNQGDKLRRMREKKKVKFEQILQSTGISFTSVKLIESGKDVKLKTLLKYKIFIENQ
jgi:predicted transcriptional regulator